MCTVVNKYKEDFDVYIGRGSMWGNPFVIGKDGDRAEVISKYAKHLKLQLKTGEVTKEQLLALNGKKLGCFCKPQACHGDVIQYEVLKAVEESKPVPHKIALGRSFTRT